MKKKIDPVKRKKKKIFGVIIIIIIIILGILLLNKFQKTELTNPASVYCIKHGGELQIIDGPNGQYGICIFPDKSACDEWAFMNGTCDKGMYTTAP